MSLLTENVVTLAKVETTYGVDAVPTGVDALVTTQVKATIFEGATVPRNLDKPNSGADQELTADYYAMIEFSVELVGSGTLGTAPAFGKLLRACRMLETIVASTSVTYTPNRPSETSLTFYFFQDGNRHRLTGARGTFTIEANSQGIPVIKFQFWGLYTPPTATANPTVLTGWDAFQVPSVLNYDNTPGAVLFGRDAVLKRFTFDAGNDVKVFNNPGEYEVRVTAHRARGNLSILALPVASFNAAEFARQNTLSTFRLEHGLDPGEHWVFEAADNTCQILKPNYGDSDGRVTLDCELLFVPTSAGGDEYQLRFAES